MKLIGFLLLIVLTFNAQAELIFPTTFTLVTGTSSGTLSSLQAEDQSGTQDAPANYMALIPNSSKASITRYTFTVPQNGIIDKLVLKVNFKGKPKTIQKWQIQIANPTTSTWINVGENAGVADGVWSHITGQILGTDLPNYIQAGNVIKLRITTNSPLTTNTAKIDQFAFDVQYVPSSTTWWQPTPGTSYQIQYAGTLNLNYNVNAYNIDMIDTTQSQINTLKAAGKKVICYFSAGSWEDWRPDQASFPESVKGNVMDGWPNEKWLDVRQLSILMPIMEARMDVAISKGCDAVDPDNMDGYDGNNTGFPLTRADQLAYYTAIANAAHSKGLAISLKNAMGLFPEAISLMDFAVNEQCYEFNECPTLFPVIAANKPVFNMEYNRQPSVFCPSMNTWNFDSLKKNITLNEARTACR